jgi:hypothetical protein
VLLGREIVSRQIIDENIPDLRHSGTNQSTMESNEWTLTLIFIGKWDE